MRPDAERRLPGIELGMVCVGYGALAVAMTWPLATNLAGLVLPDLGDPLLNAWILWWNATTVPLTEAWWNAPAFFPARGVLTFSEHLLGLWPIASPVMWLSGHPQVTYNVVLLLTFALSGTAAYALGYELTGRRDAALLCGVAFGFAPYRVAHLPHVQVLASFWMPVALLGLHRYLRDGRRRHLTLFSGAWLMQALSNGYYLVYFPVLVVLWCAWFLRPRDWRKLIGVGLAGALPIVAMAPILLKYREIHSLYGLTRDPQAALTYSADLMSIVGMHPLLALWGGVRFYHRPEGELFAGFVVVALIGLGALALLRGRQRRQAAAGAGFALGFYALGAVAMYAFALGPEPTLVGERFLPAGPYRLLAMLPGVEALRVPARFGMLMALCLAAGAALGYAVLSASWSGRARWAVAALAAAGIAADGWPAGLPIHPAPQAWDIRREEIPGALLVLPAMTHSHEVAEMYRAMTHGRPIVNGYSGHEAPWRHVLRERLDAFDPAALDALAEAGVTTIAVVNRHDSGGEWRAYAMTRARPSRVTDDGTVSLFDLPRPAGLVPAGAAGRSLRIHAIDVSEHPALIAAMTDGDLATFWHSRQPLEGGERVTIDLGGVHAVAAVETSLGRFTDAFPRELVIDVSTDGSAWTEAWRGDGASRLLPSMFDDPGDPWMRFYLGGREARYLRLTQTGRAQTSSWTIAEVRVRGQ